ncbi:MAG: helix-turn-helix transcriptional regulator [Terrimicrobiaceae bacterium]|jgi:transcriptional regulator with XRE-family HTH domain
MKAGPRQLRKRLGGLIHDLRNRHGWTQEELAGEIRKAGFDRCKRSLLSQIEVGAASLRSEEVYYLRKVFGESFEREFWNPYYHRKTGEAEDLPQGGQS